MHSAARLDDKIGNDRFCAFLPFPIKCECVLPVDSGHSSFRAGSAYISQNSTVFETRYYYVFISKEISREPFGMYASNIIVFEGG